MHVPVEKEVRYPVKKVVEKPVPVVLEKHTPFTVEKPLKYRETVKIPVTKKDGARGAASENHETIDTGKPDEAPAEKQS